MEVALPPLPVCFLESALETTLADTGFLQMPLLVFIVTNGYILNILQWAQANRKNHNFALYCILIKLKK